MVAIRIKEIKDSKAANRKMIDSLRLERREDRNMIDTLTKQVEDSKKRSEASHKKI